MTCGFVIVRENSDRGSLKCAGFNPIRYAQGQVTGNPTYKRNADRHTLLRGHRRSLCSLAMTCDLYSSRWVGYFEVKPGRDFCDASPPYKDIFTTFPFAALTLRFTALHGSSTGGSP